MSMQPAKNAIDLGIVVRDIHASLAFYEGVLGLPKVQVMPVPFGTMHRLAFGDSFVKLIDPSEAPAAGAIGLPRQLGFRYLTFQVANIDEVCAACEEAGTEFEIPRMELVPGVVIAMVRDPDGNVVEFVQRG
jgi:catechol 2,3-dioxygenase-like lactoylglutathione lyase family enzyme